MRILRLLIPNLLILATASGSRFVPSARTDEDVDIGSPGLSWDNRTIYFTLGYWPRSNELIRCSVEAMIPPSV
jgi:hypothetical protein